MKIFKHHIIQVSNGKIYNYFNASIVDEKDNGQVGKFPKQMKGGGGGVT